MREYHKTMDKRMFDFPGFYQRIAEQLPDKALLAEVGVADGSSAVFLAEAMLNLGKSFKFHWIDSMAYGGSGQIQTLVRQIGNAEIGSLVELHYIDSLNGSCRFPNQHFDFVFIDASHLFEETKADIRLWYRKVKEDGILAGHDYHGAPEVKQAVDIVIPKLVIREPTPDRQYEPELVLHVEQTDSQFGVWWVQSKYYVRLN